MLSGISAGCFEDRVEEVLTIGLDENGGAAFHYAVSLHDTDMHGDRAKERVQEFQRTLADGTASWIRAFKGTRSAALIGSELRKDEGVVTGFTAWSRTTDVELALPALLLDTPIRAQIDREPGSIGVTLFPGPALRGTRSQRRRMDAVINAWSEAISKYVETVAVLWDHIEANPARRSAVLAGMFTELGLDPEHEEPSLSAREKTIIERYEKAETTVAEVFDTPKDTAYSAQELSRLVYDPYPVHMLLTLTDTSSRAIVRKPILVEGLEPHGEFAWQIPRTSLWDTFCRLEGQWISPDPLLAKVVFTLDAKDKEYFEVDSFSRQEFAVLQVPTTESVKREILNGLRPPNISQITWPTTD